MGTNFYAKTARCESCGHEGRVLHIGKSSAGWAFLFCAYPDLGLTSKKAWESYLQDKDIEDEYGGLKSLSAFTSMVEAKQADFSAKTAPGSHWGNSSRDFEMFDDEGYRFWKGEFC